MKGERLGELEEVVLLAAGVLGADASVVGIRALLRERAGRRVTLGTLYGALDRLERKRFVHSEVRDAPGSEERRKRFFELTEVGVEALAAARAVREELWADLPARGNS